MKATSPKPKFLGWSRLNHQKGIDRALHLVALLVERGVDAHFDVWGPDHGELAALQRLCSNLGIADRVRFLGEFQREDLPTIAAECSFLLQLSRYEGMAMSVVEAMQMGLVPITTAAGEMAYYVVPEQTGIIVDPMRLDVAAGDIMHLLKDSGEFERLRANAIRTWQHAPLYADDICRSVIDPQIRTYRSSVTQPDLPAEGEAKADHI